jgi:hypothetical protein
MGQTPSISRFVLTMLVAALYAALGTTSALHKVSHGMPIERDTSASAVQVCDDEHAGCDVAAGGCFFCYHGEATSGLTEEQPATCEALRASYLLPDDLDPTHGRPYSLPPLRAPPIRS